MRSKIDVDESETHGSAPIQSLPLEILSKIMAHCITPLVPTPTYDEQHTHSLPQPLQICLVCQLWYQIGWSTPELWNILTVGLDEHDNNLLRKTMVVGDQWLSKSGILPISIRILAEGNYLLEEDGWEILFRWLAKYFTRLEVLDLQVPMECLKIMATLRPNLDLPNISSLSLKCPQAEIVEDISLNVINGNQTLANASLTSLYLRFVSMPWQTLMQLQLQEFFVDESLAALSQTPNLVHLVIKTVVRGDDNHPPPATGIVTLDKLDTLDWISGTVRAWYGSKLLKSLRAPNLRSMRVFCTEKTRVPLSTVKDFLQLSEAVLQTIIVADVKYREEDLLDLWSHQPNVNLVALTRVPEDRLNHLRRRLAGMDVLEVYHPGTVGWRHVEYFLPGLNQTQTE